MPVIPEAEVVGPGTMVVFDDNGGKFEERLQKSLIRELVDLPFHCHNERHLILQRLQSMNHMNTNHPNLKRKRESCFDSHPTKKPVGPDHGPWTADHLRARYGIVGQATKFTKLLSRHFRRTFREFPSVIGEEPVYHNWELVRMSDFIDGFKRNHE